MAEEGAAAGGDGQGYNEPFLSKPTPTASEEEDIAAASPGHGYNYGTRPWRDIAFLVVFVVVAVASIGLGIFASVNSNPDFFIADTAKYERQNGTCVIPGRRSSGEGVVASVGTGKWGALLSGRGVKASSSSTSDDDELFVRALVYSAVASAVLSLPLAWGLLFLLRKYTKELVYASLPLLFLVPVLLNITWFVACLTSQACQDFSLTSRTVIFVLVFLFIAVLLWLIYSARDRIEMSIRIIHTSAESLFNNLSLLLLLPGLFLGALVFLVAVATFAFFAYTNGKVVAEAQDYPPSSVACVWRTSQWVPAYLVLAVLAFYWAGALLHQLQSYVISGTVSQWYFAPANSSTKGATRRTLGYVVHIHTPCSMVGSVGVPHLIACMHVVPRNGWMDGWEAS